MKPQTIFVLLVLSLFLIACSKTEVVKLDQGTQQNQPTTETQPTQPTQPVEEKKSLETTNTTGKIPVKCTDTDANDYLTSGRVTVTYNDGSKQDFVDECPAQSNVEVEYVCNGNNVGTKLHICKEICVAGICIE